MPYVSEKIKIEGTKFDRRKRLSDDDRVEIVLKHEKGMSQRQLAREYGVDRKTIYNIIYPHKYQEQLETNKRKKKWLKYYDKKYNTKAVREHRQYKQKLYVKGKIKLGDD